MAMQLSALESCNNQDEVTAQLRSLPPDLNQSYGQFFAKLHSHDSDIVMTIMQWLAFSKEPLTIGQICEAVAIVKVGKEKQRKFQPGKKWNWISVEDVCADLVTVVDGNGFINNYSKINAHQDYRKNKIGTFHSKRVSYCSACQV